MTTEGTRCLHHMLVSDIPSAKCLCPHNQCSHNNCLELGTCSQLLHLLGFSPQPPTWLGESTTNRSRVVAIRLSSKRSVWAEQQSTHRYLTFKPGSGKTMIMCVSSYPMFLGLAQSTETGSQNRWGREHAGIFPAEQPQRKGSFWQKTHSKVIAFL